MGFTLHGGPVLPLLCCRGYALASQDERSLEGDAPRRCSVIA